MNKENFSLTYFVTRCFFFGTIYSLIINYSLQDSIIASFLGMFLGIFVIIFIHKMENNFLVIFLYLLFLLLSLVTTMLYVNQFLLSNTPKIVIITPAIILCLYASFKDMSVIKRSSFIFLIISLIFLLTSIIFLIKYIHINNILPLFISNIKNIFSSAFTFSILSAGPNILLKDEDIPLKKHIKYYVITCMINIFVCFVILATLTPNVAKIYSFPEYMILKRIKIMSFIENIENIMVLIWYLDYFVLIVLCLKNLYKKIKSKTIFYILTLLITILSTFYVAPNYEIALFLYHNIAILTFVLILISSVKYK